MSATEPFESEFLSARQEITSLKALNAELLEVLEACRDHAYIPNGKPWLLEKIKAAIAKARS